MSSSIAVALLPMKPYFILFLDRMTEKWRNGPRELDSAVSGIFLGFQAAKSR